jgi:hypothetical protein
VTWVLSKGFVKVNWYSDRETFLDQPWSPLPRMISKYTGLDAPLEDAPQRPGATPIRSGGPAQSQTGCPERAAFLSSRRSRAANARTGRSSPMRSKRAAFTVPGSSSPSSTALPQRRLRWSRASISSRSISRSEPTDNPHFSRRSPSTRPR